MVQIKTLFFALATGVLASACATTSATKETPSAETAQASHAFFVRAQSDDGQEIGSGTVIGFHEGECLVLTANHVVDTHETISVGLWNADARIPDYYPAQRRLSDPSTDIAVVGFRCHRGYFAEATLSLVNPPLGSEIEARGHPFPNHGFLLGGITVGRFGEGDNSDPLFATDMDIVHGFSGSGVFSRSSGQLVGLVLTRARSEHPWGLFMGVEELREVILSAPELAAVEFAFADNGSRHPVSATPAKEPQPGLPAPYSTPPEPAIEPGQEVIAPTTYTIGDDLGQTPTDALDPILPET